MKKIYMTPIAQEIKLNYQFNLLTGSLLNNDDEAIIESGDITIDEDGSLDPEAREFDLDEEDF